jgi:hypothetical protein
VLLHSGVQITDVKQHVCFGKLQVSNQEDSEEWAVWGEGGVRNITIVVSGESTGDPCTCFQLVTVAYDCWKALAYTWLASLRF